MRSSELGVERRFIIGTSAISLSRVPERKAAVHPDRTTRHILSDARSWLLHPSSRDVVSEDSCAPPIAERQSSTVPTVSDRGRRDRPSASRPKPTGLAHDITDLRAPEQSEQTP
jgi:hypothetical protein